MNSRIMMMPAGHEYDMMYLTIDGVYQGSISNGASSAESLGCNYVAGHGHENEISVLGFSYGGSNPVHKGSGCPIAQGHSDAFGITKRLDKSSPLLLNASKGEALSRIELKCYRTSYVGRPEHYYTVILQNARVVVIDTFMKMGQDGPMEHIYFSYHKISLIHERCGTVSLSNWQHTPSLQTLRMQSLEANDFNGYNAVRAKIEHNRVWLIEHPEYFLMKAQGLATFWTVVTLPFAGVALFRGSYGAMMWAFRNPVVVTDVSLDIINSWLPGIPAVSKVGYTTALGHEIYNYFTENGK